MLFVMSQVLNLDDQFPVAHISENEMMIAIHCTTLLDRRMENKNGNQGGKHRVGDDSGATLGVLSETMQRQRWLSRT